MWQANVGPAWLSAPQGWSGVGQAGQTLTSLGALNSGHWVSGQLTALHPVPASALRCPMRGQVARPQVGGQGREVAHVWGSSRLPSLRPYGWAAGRVVVW